MVDVTLNRRLVRRLSRLRLPVKELAVDRVVAIHRCRRVVALCLVQVDEEEVALGLRYPKDPALRDLGLDALAEAQGRDDFLP